MTCDAGRFKRSQNTLTGMAFQEMASELQGYTCGDLMELLITQASDIVCSSMGNADYTLAYGQLILDPDDIDERYVQLFKCYYFRMKNIEAVWSRCVIGTSDAALLFTMAMLLLSIAALKCFRTENGWKIGGWRVEKGRMSDA